THPQGIGAAPAFGRPAFPVLAGEDLEDGSERRVHGERVRRRVQVPFEGRPRNAVARGHRRIGQDAQDRVGVHAGQPREARCDPAYVPAFGDDEPHGQDPPIPQVVQDGLPPRALAEAVGPGPDRVVRAGGPGVEPEERGRADDLFGREGVRDDAERRAGRDPDQFDVALAPTRAGPGRECREEGGAESGSAQPAYASVPAPPGARRRYSGRGTLMCRWIPFSHHFHDPEKLAGSGPRPRRPRGPSPRGAVWAIRATG